MITDAKSYEGVHRTILLIATRQNFVFKNVIIDKEFKTIIM